jgi:predicted metal-dependent hydrolase
MMFSFLRPDMTKNLLELDGIVIEILRKPIKNMTLRIYPPDGRVAISAPLKLRLDLIKKQLEAKRDWIHKQRARLIAQAIPLANYESGEQHYFMGKNYALLIHQATKRTQVILEDETMHCFIKADLTLAEKETVLEKWYRQRMKEQIPALIAKWEPIIGVSVNSWGIKVMKTRWGSCNPSKKRIWLNLNLIKKPLACLEYVLVHEMVHILEASHNKRFYAFMDEFLPQWRSIKTEL